MTVLVRADKTSKLLHKDIFQELFLEIFEGLQSNLSKGRSKLRYYWHHFVRHSSNSSSLFQTDVFSKSSTPVLVKTFES